MWSKPAEAAVLGSMMRDNTCIPKVMAVIGEDDFFLPMHREIYHKIMIEYLANRPVDQTLLDGKTCDAKYLDEIAIEGYSPSIVEYYAKEVREKCRYRELVLVSDKIGKALDPNKTTDELTGEIQELALSVGSDWDSEHYIKAKDRVIGVIDNLHKHDVGLPTGFNAIDSFIGGMKPGQLIVIGARPSVGKTSLGMNILQNLDCRTLLISLETSYDALVRRYLGSKARVNMNHVEPNDYEKLTNAACEMGDMHFSVTARTVPAVRALSKQLKPKLIMIDHLHLMHGEGESENVRVGSVSNGLRELAVMDDIPVVALAQLNRDCTKRDSKIPSTADLRGSGTIEQDADIIMFLHRDAQFSDDRDSGDRSAVLKMAKNRDGPTGLTPMWFDKEYTLFSDVVKEKI